MNRINSDRQLTEISSTYLADPPKGQGKADTDDEFEELTRFTYEGIYLML